MISGSTFSRSATSVTLQAGCSDSRYSSQTDRGGRSMPARCASVWYSWARFSRADIRVSASSISCSEDRCCGAPCTSPMSTVSTVLRNSTSGSRKLSRKATKEIGTATRNTTCTEWVTASMYLL